MTAANDIPSFATHLIATLSGPPPEIDPTAQAAQCYERARQYLSDARLARELGTRKQTSTYFRAAQMMRFAASRWRDQARDEALGQKWWTGLGTDERRAWMARASRAADESL